MTRPETEVVREVQDATQQTPRTKGFDEQSLDEVDEAMESIRFQVAKHKLQPKDYLKDFDRHNKGKVTEQQFAQALDMARIVLTPRQVRLLQLYFGHDGLVSYRLFLNDLAPAAALANLTQNTLRGVKEVETRRNQFRDKDDGADLEETMEKIKLAVAQRRIRIIEHMRGFDKLRKGRVTVRAFRSALSMCGLELTLPEYRALESEYAVPEVPEHVNYVKFCREVDAVFGATDLHREPTLESQQFIPPMDIEVEANTRKMAGEEKNVAEEVLMHVARIVDERGVAMNDDFKDYDRVNRGSVTRSQFQRVLSDLRLTDGVKQSSVDALMNMFRVRVGGQENVHYRRFLTQVDAICEDLHRAPAQ
ncbi:hypothetical protein PTSG_07273 [Salpingoeca rosetta]|uniref:EF-hand domain-containing protein n=1 Tax=Salpingoeca rosetta (strain ATCC 50818 / BSB-021) TaxID=946362 RepID=F2UIY4_SALR5|nr:uncharacterized protein PTSG_07273 [Salpingoeca rosetta]EGD76932.1 hypothetical protein PTSG_07273 [Salpingoeca rosetta]|eukprot:XP_004990772.1 hypothetical protein PTSG_07273 [Salpingoeca rosetta]